MNQVVTVGLTEYREREILDRVKELDTIDLEREKLSFRDKIERGRLWNEAKLKLEQGGRKWTVWRDDNIRHETHVIGQWMRAAEAFDHPNIVKTGSETLNDLDRLLASTKDRKKRETKVVTAAAAEAKTTKAVEAAVEKAEAKAMEFAKEMIKVAQAPKQIVCPHCQHSFTH